MSETARTVDAQRLTLLLNELRLPAIKQVWPDFAARADKEAWPAARLLATLAEHEVAERDRRRIERHLLEARLPPGKTIATFAFEAVPMISKAQVLALCSGDGWLDTGANLLAFGPPGGGKSHLAAAIGLALVENGWRVLFTRTSDLVQKLQIARRELALEATIAKLDKFHLLILDDLAYVTKDQAETSVLFELISTRYERRSLMITANQPFGEWGKVFPDPAMTLAAVDRLVHHATIFEMNVESYRRKTAIQRRTGPGRPPTRATITENGRLSRHDMCGRPAGFKVASQRSMAAVRLRSCVRLLRAVYDREPRWVPRMAFQNNQPALRCLCRALDVCHSSARPIAIFSYRS
ncbi:IS21-like element helper ATPase IstB [Acidiphilium sp. C61]|uniref:IS21-like element helper ATPase IstB n=1 Tax=Acidiphilium sp. C61 TaxID=1671485 RepID=UPI002714FEF2|nr:IS21-like element helper ATPase IstB [Acidiphilium sp. C61]